MKIYLSRFVCLDAESNLARCALEASAAANMGARWVVFPESFLNGYTRHIEPERARATFSSISAAHPGTVFFFGSISEERRNRMTVWRGGREAARYDKVHLFEPNGEREIWDPGDRYACAELDGLKTGLINCNDLRYPEQARALALDGGCEALVAVAWWPWRRDHVWRTLLRARAIENGVFTIGCCICASESPEEAFAGSGNYVFDPQGEPVLTKDDRSYELDLAMRSNLLVDPRSTSVRIDKIKTFSGLTADGSSGRTGR